MEKSTSLSMKSLLIKDTKCIWYYVYDIFAVFNAQSLHVTWTHIRKYTNQTTTLSTSPFFHWKYQRSILYHVSCKYMASWLTTYMSLCTANYNSYFSFFNSTIHSICTRYKLLNKKILTQAHSPTYVSIRQWCQHLLINEVE